MKAVRIWAIGLALLSACAWLGANVMRGQTPEMGDAQGRSQQDPSKDMTPDRPMMPDAEKKALEDNDKDMKKKVDRLYTLATELKAEVDKTDSSKVLSLNLVKKAEEIEKLARDIKNKGKG